MTSWFWSANISGGQPLNFTLLPANPPAPPDTFWGGYYLDYDPANRILYSSNLVGGFWRYVLP